MRTLASNITRTLALVFTGFLLATSATTVAQEKFTTQSVDMMVSGTSTIHDWEMKSNQAECNATIAMSNDKVTFSNLTFNMPAKSLKSGHGMMDKNTYKALSADKNPNITLVLSSANVTPSGANTYNVKAVGNLTIAGNTKQTDVVATLKYNPATKSFTCTGNKTFKMSDFGVKPPTVMMGTIKTGDQITITYNLVIKS